MFFIVIFKKSKIYLKSQRNKTYLFLVKSSRWLKYFLLEFRKVWVSKCGGFRFVVRKKERLNHFIITKKLYFQLFNVIFHTFSPPCAKIFCLKIRNCVCIFQNQWHFARIEFYLAFNWRIKLLLYLYAM